MKTVLKNSISVLLIVFVFQNCNTNKSKKPIESTTTQVTDSMTVIKEKQAPVTPKQPEKKTCKCNAKAYVTTMPDGGIELFNDHKEVVQKVSFDLEDEDFLVIELKMAKENKFQIKSLEFAFEETKKNYENLWISNTYLRIFLPDSNTKVSLFSAPNTTAKVLLKVNPFDQHTITLLGCCKNWIYGLYKDKEGKETKAWFNPNDICSNPLSNC